MRNGRYFTDFTEESYKTFIGEIEMLAVEIIGTTNDQRRYC